ncbi:mas-related G-protein coupled receptor member H-like [Paroedura picta]|uniref:mas-related G-protein coupled receptor member H-like n=1 Tax=Paroedura picta TaxID=143630 RepID=UPI004056C01C
MSVNIGLTTLSMMERVPQNFNDSSYFSFQNISKRTNESFVFINNNSIDITFITLFVITILGAVANGVVIWLLVFHVKRNPFMTYILNMAVADLGVLLSLLPDSILYVVIPYFYLTGLFFVALLMYSASQFLLMAISIDRCVAVFFPAWHRSKRNPRLCIIVCTLIWIVSLLLTTISLIFFLLNPLTSIKYYYPVFVNVLVCLPVMILVTVSLFIKTCLKEWQPRRGRLWTIILLSLVFFLIFAIPCNILFLLGVLNRLKADPTLAGLILVCLNSSLKPVIYFLVGRRWRSSPKETMKMILERVFREEDGCVEEAPAETEA